MRLLAKIGKLLFFLTVIAVLSGIIYFNRDNYKIAYENIRLAVGLDKPCSKPIVYSIGEFSDKFGMDRSQFITNMAKATDIWNNAIGKQLFVFSDINDTNLNPIMDTSNNSSKNTSSSDRSLLKTELTVNLIFDSRQKNTVELINLSSTINSGKNSYDDLKAQYISLQKTYNDQKSVIDNLTAKYEADRIAYEKNVAYWNDRGGAPKQQFSALESQRSELNHEANDLNDLNKKLNITVNDLNGVADRLNAIGKSINQTVGKYNTVSTSNGPEFQEGEYVSDANGKRINIYQYNDYAKLIRVLAHEFGHALGLDHVEDPKAIMYAYNMDSSIKLTPADIAALKKVCGVL